MSENNNIQIIIYIILILLFISIIFVNNKHFKKNEEIKKEFEDYKKTTEDQINNKLNIILSSLNDELIKINKQSANKFNEIQKQRANILGKQLNITNPIPIPNCLLNETITFEQIYHDGIILYVRNKDEYNKYRGKIFIQENNKISCQNFLTNDIKCEELCKK